MRQQPKQHVNQFSRFCGSHGYHQQTDTQTQDYVTSVALGLTLILCFAEKCSLTNAKKTGQQKREHSSQIFTRTLITLSASLVTVTHFTPMSTGHAVHFHIFQEHS